MKGILVLLLVGAFCGCANTWYGVKKDANNAGKWTKEKIHNAASWMEHKTR